MLEVLGQQVARKLSGLPYNEAAGASMGEGQQHGAGR